MKRAKSTSQLPQSTPHVMKSTAAFARLSNHESSPHLSSPRWQTCSTSRRAQLLNFASKRLPINATPRSRKDSRIPVRQRTNVNVSSPLVNYNRRKSSLNLASPVKHTTAPPEPVKKCPVESTLDAEKPLPSLPIAIVGSKSPVHRRSLMDATEKPLQYGLSSSITENWPALSPVKPSGCLFGIPSTSAEQQNSMRSVLQPSLGESVIVSMQKSRIDEGSSPPCTGVMKSSSTPSSRTPSTPQTSPQHSPEFDDQAYLYPRQAPRSPHSPVSSSTRSKKGVYLERTNRQLNSFANTTVDSVNPIKSHGSRSANTSHPRDAPRLALPPFKFPSSDDHGDVVEENAASEYDHTPMQVMPDALDIDHHDAMSVQDDNKIGRQPSQSDVGTCITDKLQEGTDLKPCCKSDHPRGPQVRISSAADYYILGRGNQPSDEAALMEEDLVHCQHLPISKAGTKQCGQNGNLERQTYVNQEVAPNSELHSTSPRYWFRIANQADGHRPVSRASVSDSYGHKATAEFAVSNNIKRLSSNDLGRNSPLSKFAPLTESNKQTPHTPDDANQDAANRPGHVESSPLSAYSLRHALYECTSEQTASNDLSSQSLPSKNMKKRRSQLFPPRTSSRQGDLNRLTGLRRPTPQSTKPVQSVGGTERGMRMPTQHKHMLTYTQSMQALNPHSRYENNMPSSPLPTGKTVTTGKAMIHNIKGLFNNARHVDELHNPPVKDSQRSNGSRTTPVTTVLDSDRLPESRLRRKQTKSYSQDQQCKHKNGSKKDSYATGMNHENVPNFMTSALESDEIKHATALAFELLNRARDTDNNLHQKELIDLAKTLVNVVTMARDAEKHLEESRQSTAKAEMTCVMIRREIMNATGTVAAITSDRRDMR